MKPANRAPFFVCLYHGLCDVARRHGYALAIHGSVITDMDLVAVPWTDEAVPAEQLKCLLMAHVLACGYVDLLRQDGTPEEIIAQIMARQYPGTSDEGTPKPHGRVAWNLYLATGTKIDLSVMPRASTSGVQLIAAERTRQIEVEKWTPAHDDQHHSVGDLLRAAQSYVMQADGQVIGIKYPACFIPKFWPWARQWWKPSPDPIRNLVKAGALIAAEIDRLQRLNRKG